MPELAKKVLARLAQERAAQRRKPEGLLLPLPDASEPYRAALRRFWTLPPDAPPEVCDGARDEVLLREAALPPDEAWTILRAEAERFHAETGVCPFCQEPGPLHLPAASPAEELA